MWLLDLDGVVNAGSRSLPTHVWPKSTWRQIEAIDSDGLSWPIKAAQPVLDFLRAVHGAGRAEIRWHSTWQQDSLTVGKVLGLPDFGVAEGDEYKTMDAQGWWKVPAARRVLAGEGRGLLWTDDDSITELTSQERADLQGLGRTLIVAPRLETGLCPRHLRRIDRFLQENAA